MWYFSWILGVTAAILLAVVNAMMCEARECAANNRNNGDEDEGKPS